MSNYRQAQNQSHATKNNTLSLAIVALLIGIVSLQVWLLVAGLNTVLGGNTEIAWPCFIASLVLFLGGVALLKFLPQPMRTFSTNKK